MSLGTGLSLIGLETACGWRWPLTDGVILRGAPMGCLLVLLFGARRVEHKQGLAQSLEPWRSANREKDEVRPYCSWPAGCQLHYVYPL